MMKRFDELNADEQRRRVRTWWYLGFLGVAFYTLILAYILFVVVFR